jgi:hypothetical protein
MGAAGTATRIEHDENSATTDEMLQDILYDILATGIDARQTSVAPEDIERFLHEHARAPKSAAEFREFFDRHGLHADTRTAESAILELPPITTPREASPQSVEPPIELTLSDIDPAGFADDPFELKRVPPPPRRVVPRGAAWLIVALLAIAFALLTWRGVATVSELRAEVSRASVRHQQDRSALRRLSDQTANLESSVAATGELVQRMDQKSDLLIDSLLARPKPAAKPRLEAPRPQQSLPPSPEPAPPVAHETPVPDPVAPIQR